MSTTRFLREVIILLVTVGGTVIGFTATRHMEPTVNIVCAFLGMALFGAFADICIRGGK